MAGNVIPRAGLPTQTPTGRANVPPSADSIIIVPGIETVSEFQQMRVFEKADYRLVTYFNSTRPSS